MNKYSLTITVLLILLVNVCFAQKNIVETKTEYGYYYSDQSTTTSLDKIVFDMLPDQEYHVSQSEMIRLQKSLQDIVRKYYNTENISSTYWSADDTGAIINAIIISHDKLEDEKVKHLIEAIKKNVYVNILPQYYKKGMYIQYSTRL